MSQGLLKTRDVCDRLNISRDLTMDLIRSGQLPAYKIGREWRIDPRDLQKFLDHCKTRTPRG